ncbi:hypothetical protein BIV57_09595 [Mangrovactinospora gilvigrisea]|uniref:Uncharacterized protein n=1 Tax=Mangrovactinospora gilvigrisea TaxID=1428644 RepID=A0A1J7BGM7_9ACTN|nr:hypothetical protein [Mangrovactinospora gilvigrisea]OIV37806.1 hypothetical protein BIV57_09595 [Mangrovactinospora gilvigrisea]
MSVFGKEAVDLILGWIVSNALGTSSVVVSLLIALIAKSPAIKLAAVIIAVLLMIGVGGSLSMSHSKSHDGGGSQVHATATARP